VVTIMQHTLCAAADLQEAKAKIVRADGRPIAIIKIEDEIFAIDARCPHWNGALGAGPISVARREIVCPLHGFRFSLRDGACVAGAGRPAAETFEVRIEDGMVIGEIPEREIEIAV
jgi:3-phenylpropionate/trans-cinnamate dioxygenase ferredoxin component